MAKKVKKPEQVQQSLTDTYVTDSIKLFVNMEVGEELARSLLERNRSQVYRNRPQRKAVIRRYAFDMLNRNWKITGEPIILSNQGHLIDGQHRLEAILLANKLLRNRADEFDWEAEVTAPMLFITGIPEENLDSLNTGEPRKGYDVIYRQGRWDELPKKWHGTLSRLLAGAARVVWLRIGGQRVKDAPKFPHSELVAFLNRHPNLESLVRATHTADKGPEENDRLISTLVSPAYVAGVAYLGACRHLDRQVYLSTTGPVALRKEWLEEAKDFVETLADKLDQQKGSPILALDSILKANLRSEKRMTRDAILNTLILTYKAWADKQSVTTKDLRPARGEIPRLGGLDSED